MTIEDEMRAALATFLIEASELLVEMESGLLDLERGDGGDEVVGSVFRSAHTIKGSAGMFGLERIVVFTHKLESVLDRLRDDEIQVSAALVGVLLRAKDHLALLIDGVATGAESDQQQADIGTSLMAELGALSADPVDADVQVSVAAPGGDGALRPMHISLRFGADCLRSGMDPISFISYLSTVGDVVAVTTVADLLPTLELMDPETCYLAFEVTLHTSATVAAVEAVFEFVWGDSDIRVLTVANTADDYADLVDSYPPHIARSVYDAIVRSGTVLAEDLAARVRVPRAAVPDVQDVTPVESRTRASHPMQRATDDRNTPEAASRVSSTIRVDAGRLDRLIDTVGELLIAGAGAALGATTSGEESLRNSIGEVMRLIEGVRDDALRLRMVPIGTTFSRFQRVVRDVSTLLGKNVVLEIRGGETEVDKALMEQIGDPLMHLVRNALDHGIEAPDVRAAHGKPARGVLRIEAYHDSGAIVVVVEDDGGGIDADRVFAKAVERGLVDQNAKLTSTETYALVFEPGFSTASEVSNLSGRGVGLDVVKRNVTALRGTIDVESRPGNGTTIRMRLPLTLAIIDGFLVGVGTATFAIPLDRVVECVELPASSRHRDYMDLRGEVLPLIRLWSEFAIIDERSRRESVVIVQHAGVKTGLVVDILKGEFQTVIKPLGKIFEKVEGIGGSTILGNGEVALIIDVAVLVRHVTELNETRIAQPA